MSEEINLVDANKVEDSEKVIFTPQQQAVFDREMARVKREAAAAAEAERLKGKQSTEDMRQRGAEALRASKGETDAQKFLQQDRTTDEASELERQQVAKYFGKDSDSGAANKLAMTNKPLYDSLKKLAVKHGLAAEIRHPKTSAKTFRPNAT